ncbi:TldD/PmbA family protein [Algirhabdus cladophorae]|uniref:TldD/PmbA family protein n=1 Tax=Algirhabdus cladophorae TaxID=3377108 RepID=UPI003B84AA7C
MSNLESLTQRLLEFAKSAGADAADSLAVDGTSINIDVRVGKLEQAERSEGIDIGLRVLVGQRQACVSASDTRDETLRAMAERAVVMAKEAPEDPYIGLADPADLARDWNVDALELADPGDEPTAAFLQEQAEQAEAAALTNTGISQVQSASAGYGKRNIHLATSTGFSGGYSRTDHGVSCVAIAGTGTGMERDFDSDVRIWSADLRDPAEIGKVAAERTVARMGARKPKTGAYPVVFDERISSSLIGHMLAAVNGAAIARGSSWLMNNLGKQILPNGMSVVEDPGRPRIAGSRPFDGEGLLATKRAIVEDGVLQSWTLDLATARKLGLNSTHSASRGTSSPPSPSVGNIALTQGTQTQAELLKDMGRGLLVTSMIGSSINPNTGDYSRGASGYWVENGQIQYPINECTLAGNLNDMLLSLRAANDARLHLSRLVPSLLVEGLTLAGE